MDVASPPTTPLRILAVIDSLGSGGAEGALLAASRELRSRGHEVEVAALYGADSLAGALRDAGAPVHLLSVASPRNVPLATLRLARLLRSRRPDIVHSHLFFAGLASAFTKPLARGPRRVATFHNLGYESYPVDSAWRRVRRRIDATAMQRGMDGWLAVSGAVASHYAQHLGLNGVQVIPNGIDLDELRELAGPRADSGSSDGSGTILCAGTLRHEKGHRFLLAALDELRQRGLRPAVTLAGEGPLRGELEREIADRSLGDQVRMVGAVPHQELIGLIAGSDVVAMPSTHEGLPLTLVEAMGVGAALVASAAGGIPEAVEDGRSGLLVAPGDASGLADALGRALTDPGLRERLSAAARAQADASFSVSHVADEHEAFYRELMHA